MITYQYVPADDPEFEDDCYVAYLAGTRIEIGDIQIDRFDERLYIANVWTNTDRNCMVHSGEYVTLTEAKEALERLARQYAWL